MHAFKKNHPKGNEYIFKVALEVKTRVNFIDEFECIIRRIYFVNSFVCNGLQLETNKLVMLNAMCSLIPLIELTIFIISIITK